MVKAKTMEKQRKNKEKTQVLTFRIPFSRYELFEKTCLEKRQPMSKVMQEAVKKYLSKELTLNN
jgi:predicted GNAT superfamily acetyltransferase